MTTNEIIKSLREKETDFLETKTFSQFPGIYAFFYLGNDFPIFGNVVSKHQIIYIGKTESSQEKRDAKTHFTTGKTGSSTVRKTIGSLLCGQEYLKPIPRNDIDYTKGIYSHFKFAPESEEIITNWMKNNLALSFYDYRENKNLIDKLETEIIKELKPILNIDHKNSENPYKEQILQLRKICATMAMKNTDYKVPTLAKKIENNSNIQNKIYGTSSSGNIYIDNITESDAKSRKIRIKVENKHLFPAEKSDNTISYPLDFRVGNTDFVASYTIGSKDGKSRSGILKLGDNIYNNILRITEGTNLKISKSKENKYSVEKL